MVLRVKTSTPGHCGVRMEVTYPSRPRPLQLEPTACRPSSKIPTAWMWIIRWPPPRRITAPVSISIPIRSKSQPVRASTSLQVQMLSLHGSTFCISSRQASIIYSPHAAGMKQPEIRPAPRVSTFPTPGRRWKWNGRQPVPPRFMMGI